MNRFFQSLLIVLVLAISLGSISYAGSIQNFIVNLTSQVTGTLPVANGGTGSNSGVAAGTSTPPSNPTVGTLWNCNAISCLHASQNPKERYPVQSLGTQEQTVIPIGTTLVDLFSGGSGVIQYSSIPVTSDPLASATFYGSTAGTTLTVSEPSATASGRFP